MDSLPSDEIKFFADRSYTILGEILSSLGVREIEVNIDREINSEVTEFFLRDIYRIDKQQRGSVSIAKWAGYWGFWVRKLKPIKLIRPSTERGFENISNNDAANINELVALHFALEIAAAHRRYGNFQDRVLENCSRAQNGLCDGVECFWKYAERYLNFSDEFFIKYITYSMRNRTFGPHHFALLVENMIFSACTGLE
ncbi:hypothetical protein [Pseudoroseicyclus sp. CXY001]|uniref:hypothetical protein n=1 Tax=Pseudoroseicyclus sp. CXY001 TaxID=3242492 RepID=UPI00358DA0C3